MLLPLALSLCWHPASPLPPSWTITRDDNAFANVPYFSPSNCDKDGSLVAARLASAVRGVSDTRAQALNISRYADASYADQVAELTLSFYKAALSPLLTMRGAPLVVGSVHRVALYLAETLHAAVLPAQTLMFAANVSQACDAARGGDSIVLVGADFGLDALWLWVKPARVEGVPPAHMNALRVASELVLVRVTDAGSYLGTFLCPSGAQLTIHSSLRSFAEASGNPQLAALWAAIEPAMQPVSPTTASALRQWEWGLPDATLEAYSAAWSSLGRLPSEISVVEGEEVAGYSAVPRLWEAYLDKNGVRPRGIDVLSYWIAQPALERADGVLPFPAYAFYKPEWHPLFDNASAALGMIIEQTSAALAAPHSRGFITTAGSSTDVQGILSLWELHNVSALATTIVGFDTPPAQSTDGHGRPSSPAHAVAALALQNVPALLPPRAWLPLTPSEAIRALMWSEKAVR
jgi:hypothetical protein